MKITRSDTREINRLSKLAKECERENESRFYSNALWEKIKYIKVSKQKFIELMGGVMLTTEMFFDVWERSNKATESQKMKLSERIQEWTHPTAEYDDDFDKVLLRYADEVAQLEAKVNIAIETLEKIEKIQMSLPEGDCYKAAWKALTSLREEQN